MTGACVALAVICLILFWRRRKDQEEDDLFDDDDYEENGYEEDDKEKESYMTYVLQTQKSLSSKAYMPFLKAVAKVDEYPRLSNDGQKLILDGDKNIFCENAAYKVINNKDETVIETITISQNEQGIDTEDRIEKLRKYIEKIV